MTIKHILNYAEEIGFIKQSSIGKFRLLRESQKERPRFTEEQVQKVIDAVDANCRPLFIFIRETGCRLEEALSLKRSQIQTDGERWYIVLDENTKSRKYRYVPLTGAGLAATQVFPDLKGCPYVFYNPKTMRRRHTCPRSWESARVVAGVPNLQVKDRRRQFAIDLAERGTPMHDIQQVLGHASVATTEKYYAHFSPEASARRVLRTLQAGADPGRIDRSGRVPGS